MPTSFEQSRQWNWCSFITPHLTLVGQRFPIFSTPWCSWSLPGCTRLVTHSVGSLGLRMACRCLQKWVCLHCVQKPEVASWGFWGHSEAHRGQQSGSMAWSDYLGHLWGLPIRPLHLSPFSSQTPAWSGGPSRNPLHMSSRLMLWETWY